jgi:S-(hydroxymethyl)glutathione dehydrogenase/alcohol dehydrogenase
VNSALADPVAAVKDLTSGAGVEYSFDTTAVPAAAQASFDCLALRGVLTCLATPPADLRAIVGTERMVRGSTLGSTRIQDDLPRWLELYRQGRLLLDEMISFELPPGQFDRALSELATGRAARAVLRFDQSARSET